MLRRVIVVGAVALVLVVVLASPAGAHAQLVSTEPPAATVLDDPPATITLVFDEPVEASLGAVRLYDGSADRLDVSPPQHPDGDRSRVRVDAPDLENGSYVVTWRVISGDSHPVQGALTFQVGPDATANVTSLAERLLAEQGGDSVVGVVYGIDRFLVFASIAVLLGGIGFLVLIVPSARGDAVARRLLWVAAGLCAVATAAGIGLQGAYAAGLGLTDAARPTLVREVLDTQFGQVSLVRLALLVVVALLLRRLLAPGPPAETPVPVWWPAAATLTVVAIAATPGFAGHATSGDHVALALVADTIHVLAMSLWVGGLVFLVAVLLPRRDAARLEAGVTRFSRLALACVVTLVGTGSFQSWRQVGSLDALRDTDYGQLLVVKIVLVAGMIVVAAFSREVVYRLYGGARHEALAEASAPSGGALDLDPGDHEGSTGPVDERRELRRLRGSIVVEVLFAVVVLAVTAMLVNTPPGRADLEGPFASVVRTEDVTFEVLVDPAIAGPNELHVTVLTAGGGPADPLEVSGAIELPDEDIAAIEVPMRRLGPGHYLASGFNVPIAGEWHLEIRALVSEVDEVQVDVPIPIR